MSRLPPRGENQATRWAHAMIASQLILPGYTPNLSIVEQGVTPERDPVFFVGERCYRIGSRGMERTMATIRDSIAAFLDANLRKARAFSVKGSISYLSLALGWS